MTPPVIADSSALIALMSAEDALHEQARRVSVTTQAAGRFVLIPPMVFAETLNMLGKLFGRRAALADAARILADPELHIPDTATELIPAALALWKRQGSSVSFTDCIVMASADHFGTQEIFGFDAVFAKNGYRLPEEGREAA